MRRIGLLIVIALTVASCSSASGAIARATPSPSIPVSPSVIHQDAVPGPGGMTLSQEIGAVMMVGFQGPASSAVINDWRTRQFGGLIIVPINQNVHDAAAARQLIETMRGVMQHPLLVATNQEGGTVCFPQIGVPCMAGARQVAVQGASAVQAEMRTMSSGLKSLGFDINFAPVADVWDGVHPFMSERSYGQSPTAVAQDVTAAIAGIHEAGILAAAKHFPGHGTADADSHLKLPLVSLSLKTLQARDWVPFEAAVGAQVDFVMVGHLSVPALDPSAPSSMSATVLQDLRQVVGYQGTVISDDLQMGALMPQFPPPVAAVRFLKNGGDMVIVSHDIGVADATYDAIRGAVINGDYPRSQLDASVQKLLALHLRFLP